MRLARLLRPDLRLLRTLIDWEAGILTALRAWAAAVGQADDEALLAASRGPRLAASSPSRRRPTRGSWPACWRISPRSSAPTPAPRAEAFGGSVKDWPAFPDSAERRSPTCSGTTGS